MQRAGHEFPERFEVLKAGTVGVVFMRGGVMHIGGQPDGVQDLFVADKAQQLCEFQFAALGCAGIAIGDGFDIFLILGHLVPDIDADRHVAGDDLPRRARGFQRGFQPIQLRLAQNLRLGGDLILHPFAVGAAIAAQIKEEDVQQRTIGDLAIDAAGFGGRIADRGHFMEGALGAGGQQGDGFFGIAVIAGQVLAGRPVVDDLVVVPLKQRRHHGRHGLRVLIHLVVFPAAAEFVQRLGDLADLIGQHGVAPDAALDLDLVLHRAVGIDGVAGMDEKIGLMRGHGGIGAHALVIDAPTLTGGIARPDEPDVAAGGRRGAELADDRFAAGIAVGQVGGGHAVEDGLIALDPLKHRLDGIIAFGKRVQRGDLTGILEAFIGGDFQRDPRGAVGAGPDHAALRGDVARLHAMGKDRAAAGAADGGHRQQRAGGKAGHQKAAAGHAGCAEGHVSGSCWRDARRVSPAA